jgi:hypothetical protein
MIKGKMVSRIRTYMWAQSHGGGDSALIPHIHILKDFSFIDMEVLIYEPNNMHTALTKY